LGVDDPRMDSFPLYGEEHSSVVDTFPHRFDRSDINYAGAPFHDAHQVQL
jgi:hypothetical protein